MPVKRRVPKAKVFVPSPELLELYRRALELKASGHHREPSPFSEDGHSTEEYSALWHRIHDLCGLRPWDANPLDVEEGGVWGYPARPAPKTPETGAALLKYPYIPPPQEQRVNGFASHSLNARDRPASRQADCTI